MGELTKLFENMPVNSPALKKMQALTDKLAGGSGQYKRLSIKGGKWRMIENGEQVAVNRNNEIELIVVGASPVVRQYYEGAYDPSADKAKPPVCWSDDSNSHKPSENVPEDQRLASSCNDCPKNIKGSGTNNSRACRYSQRLAIVFPGKLKEVFQLSLPATSLFGEAERGLYPMQGYARLLKSHSTPISAIVTEMSFDEESETPKLFFKPVRPLEEEELETVAEVAESQEVKDAVTLTVSQADGVQDKPNDDTDVVEAAPPKAKPRAKAKPKAEDVATEQDDDDDDEMAALEAKLAAAKKAKAEKAAKAKQDDDEDDGGEPTKVKSTKPSSNDGNKLADVIDGWDDDDDE